MTQTETSKIIAILTVAYPIQYKDMSESKLKQTINLWHMMLEDKEYAEVNAALKSFISTDAKGFPPTIGQVIDMIHKLKETANSTQYLNESEAWAIVYKAICNSIYNSVAEFNKLPKIVQKSVGTADNLKELAMTEDFNLSVESSNFKRIYRTTVERQKEIAKIPSKVLAIQQQMINRIKENSQ